MDLRRNLSRFPARHMGLFDLGFSPGAKIILLFFLFLFLISAGCAGTPVIKMPSPLPDMVKDFRSVRISVSRTAPLNTGIRVVAGDFITIMARGEIYREQGNQTLKEGPNWRIAWQVGERGYPWTYHLGFGSRNRRVTESGTVFLRSMTDPYLRHFGSFDVDIIVWQKEDPVGIANFLQDLSSQDPDNETLKQFAEEFKSQKEMILAEEKAKKEVEETKKAIATLQGKGTEMIGGVGGLSKTGEGSPEKEKQIAELNERLQKAEQSLKDLEGMKEKLAEQEEREKRLMAQLEQAQEERMRLERAGASQIPPIIVIAGVKEGMIVDTEYLSLSGVAESIKGLAKLEILVNQLPVSRKEGRDLQLVAKDASRADFSERIRLRAGKNEVAVVAQDVTGLSAKRTFSIQFTRKKEAVWAVIIGISQYKNIPSLKYAANDAREFYRYLTDVNGVPKDHIWLLLDGEATLDKMRSALGTQLRRQAGRDDMVIIYLAGHGATERDATSPDGDGLEKYILPNNADPKDLYSTAIPMSEVARVFNRISSERLVFISDTCYSGASGGRTIPVLGVRANVSGTFLERLSQGKGRVILTASDANEVSVEKDELMHGVFTYYLLEALRGRGDVDKDGLITIDEVYRYVSMKVPQATGQDQHPVKKGEMTGQIVLGVVAK